MKASEVHNMTNDELRQQLHDKMESLWHFQFQKTTGVMENVRASRNVRKDIARLKTVLREREMAAQQGADQNKKAMQRQ